MVRHYDFRHCEAFPDVHVCGCSSFGLLRGDGSESAIFETSHAPCQPSNLSQYVRDQTALVVLGKALFWDMQAGSDCRLACATCHFDAGADHRVQN